MKLSSGEKVFQGFNYVFLALLGLATIYPLWEVIRISLSTPAEASRMAFTLWPKELSLDAYKHVLHNSFIWSGYKNTIYRMVLGTAIQMVLTILVAYPLSRKKLPHRSAFTMIIVFTMFFSGGLIPEYLLIQHVLHMGNTIWALVLPPAINTFSMLIVRNYFMAIPHEIEESAKMDGASDLRILTSIMVPLSVLILVTVGLWSMVAHWNAWFDALIYIRNGADYPLQMVLRKIIIEATPMFDGTAGSDVKVNIAAETIKAASIIAGTLPIVMIYPFIQKYFIRGVMIGSLKG